VRWAMERLRTGPRFATGLIVRRAMACRRPGPRFAIEYASSSEAAVDAVAERREIG
jgi:hypothetical protein